MAYQLQRLGTVDGAGEMVSDADVRRRMERLDGERRRYRRLWAYYRNPMLIGRAATEQQGSQRPYRQAQEWGMPPRITGLSFGGDPLGLASASGATRKEVVIENDIAWRVETMVDYLFGKSPVIASTAPDQERQRVIEQLLGLILEHNGGSLFLQQLALLGAVYGFVDVLVKLDPQTAGVGDPAVVGAGQWPAPSSGEGPAQAAASGGTPPRGPDEPRIAGASHSSHDEPLSRLARMIRLEVVEPARALPFLSPQDYRVVHAYGQCYEIGRPANHTVAAGDAMRDGNRSPKWWQRMRRSAGQLLRTRGDAVGPAEQPVVVMEILTADHWQRYEDEVLVAAGINSLGEIPLVHIQNTAVPFEYSGGSDVEPLLPLQDELNTRLSDRAHRITMQSFKMYLGKCVEGFGDMPVSPGRMWTTNDENAEVIEFGGDANCPSEESHIRDLREAMDKISGVAPVAAGVIRDRVGRLTSAAALRVTLMSLLAKTERKRTTYGLAIGRICELSLAWLDKAGVFPTRPEERQVELHWPSPLPENDMEKLQEAETKARLGVPKEVVLKELGYDADVTSDA